MAPKQDNYGGEDHTTINTIIRIEAVVAIMACLSIIFIHKWFPEMKTPTYSFVFYMALTGIGSEISDLMVSGYVYSHDNLCTLQGFIGQFFDISSVFWATVVARSLYVVIVEERSITEEYTLKCHQFVWGTALVLSLLPFTTNSYGPAGPWCWITAPQTDQVRQRFAQDMGTTWRAFSFYIPIWICFFYVVYSYTVVIQTIKKYANLRDTLGQHVEGEQLRKMADSMYWFPAAFIGAWVVATVCRMYR